MVFNVYSRTKAKSESYKLKIPTVVISITDPDKDLNCFAHNTNLVAVCRVQFHDTEPDILLKNEILMTASDAAKIRRFVDAYKDKVEQIIVHCEAGISRSAGVMAAIQKYLIGNDDQIFNNRRFCPNMYVYNLMIKEFFGSGSVFSEIES